MYSLDEVKSVDPEIASCIVKEEERQNSHIELIPSENWVSKAVMAAMGSPLTNKYAEGYPGKRYYGGCQCVDEVEQLAIDRAKELFGCTYANVQPHSGAQANMAVFFAMLKPGDTVMGMNLAHGGHLTHGSPANFSGAYFNIVPYGVNDDGVIDYEEVRRIANECHPKLIVAGASAYARIIDFKKFREIADEVVLLDIKEGVAEGKMLDIFQTATLMDFDTKLTGVTNDYAATAGSDVVVITSGMPRKPGMTREELIGVNAGIVSSVVENVLKYSPKAIILIISNPMDTMTYLALKKSGLPKNQIFGMGGALDTARFKCYLSKALNANSNEIEGMVIGGHGDTTMIPLAGKAAYKGIPVTELLSKEELDKVVADTMVGGATLTKLLGTSAWYAPGAAAAYVVESIIRDQKKVIVSCTALDGEYGQKDICIGVPVILGKNGIEKIVELELNADEKAKFAASAAAVHKTNAALKEVGAL